MLENNEYPETDQPQVTNISHADVGSVHAVLVRMHQADAEVITAEEVEMQNSAAGSVKATNVSGRMVLIGAVNAEEVSVQESGLGYARAGNMSVSGYTGAVSAGSAEIHHGMAGFVAGREVHVNESRTGFLFARTVHGNVTTALDTRGALIAGLTAGLFTGLMILLGRALFRRS